MYALTTCIIRENMVSLTHSLARSIALANDLISNTGCFFLLPTLSELLFLLVLICSQRLSIVRVRHSSSNTLLRLPKTDWTLDKFIFSGYFTESDQFFHLFFILFKFFWLEAGRNWSSATDLCSFSKSITHTNATILAERITKYVTRAKKNVIKTCTKALIVQQPFCIIRLCSFSGFPFEQHYNSHFFVRWCVHSAHKSIRVVACPPNLYQFSHFVIVVVVWLTPYINYSMRFALIPYSLLWSEWVWSE